MQNKSKKPLLAGYKRYKNVRWQIAQPVSAGPFHVSVAQNIYSPGTIDRIDEEAEIEIIPLQELHSETTTQFTRAQDVTINGSQALSIDDYLVENSLPAGVYIFRIKVRGTGNWDRKEVYVVLE